MTAPVSIQLLLAVTLVMTGLFQCAAEGQSNLPGNSTSTLNETMVSVFEVPDDGNAPDAEIDDAGNIHVVYFSNDNVYYIMSSDQGSTFSDAVRVNSEAGFASAGMHRGPDIAVGTNGRIHVIWFNAAYQQKRPKKEWGVMYSRFDPESNSFEPDRNLNQKPSDNFSIAADKQGNVAVIWMAGDVFTNISEDGGDTFSEPVNLKTDPCECCASRAIYDSDGNLSVMYRDKADDFRDTWLAILSPGDNEFKHVKISETAWYITNCPMTASYLASDSGGLLVGWKTKGQIYYSRLDNRGKPFSAKEISVAESGRYPVTLRTSNGTTLVAWKDGTQLQWQRFDADDKTVGKRGSRECRFGDRPSGIVTKSGNFLLFP